MARARGSREHHPVASVRDGRFWEGEKDRRPREALSACADCPRGRAPVRVHQDRISRCYPSFRSIPRPSDRNPAGELLFPRRRVAPSPEGTAGWTSCPVLRELEPFERRFRRLRTPALPSRRSAASVFLSPHRMVFLAGSESSAEACALRLVLVVRTARPVRLGDSLLLTKHQVKSYFGMHRVIRSISRLPPDIDALSTSDPPSIHKVVHRGPGVASTVRTKVRRSARHRAPTAGPGRRRGGPRSRTAPRSWRCRCRRTSPAHRAAGWPRGSDPARPP